MAIAGFLALTLFKLPHTLQVITAGLIGLLVAWWRPSLLIMNKPHGPGRGTDKPEKSPPAALHDDDSASPDHARFSRQRLAITLLVCALGLLLPLAGLVMGGSWNGPLSLLARFFTRVALLSFGGAYAVLPYVAQGTVEPFGWLSADQMLDGLALGETTPGPLIMVVAFVGFMGSWNHGPGVASGNWTLAIAAPPCGSQPRRPSLRGPIECHHGHGGRASLALFFSWPCALAGWQLQSRGAPGGGGRPHTADRLRSPMTP